MASRRLSTGSTSPHPCAQGLSYLGVDGCRDGWFCVGLGPLDQWGYRLIQQSGELIGLAATARSILIDIPIGCPDAGPNGRLCDSEARRQLGAGRGSSVFATPVRPVLAADSYAQALALNRAATGRGLSKQTWNIVPRIRAIDALLRDHPSLRDVLRECHPELCFWALNGERAMRNGKKREEGRQERLAVLAHFFPQCRALLGQAAGEFLRRQLALDDIIDAMVCAVTAKYGHGDYRTLPDRPPRDGMGLPMEMVYCLPNR